MMLGAGRLVEPSFDAVSTHTPGRQRTLATCQTVMNPYALIIMKLHMLSDCTRRGYET